MRLIDADEAKEIARSLGMKVPWSTRSVLLLLDAAKTIEHPIITPSPNIHIPMEQLREMDGDKIYVYYIDGFYTDENGAYFGKFEKLVRECNGRLTACELPLEYYGKTWFAYRRKLEEGTV